MGPDLVRVFAAHFAQLRRTGAPSTSLCARRTPRRRAATCHAKSGSGQKKGPVTRAFGDGETETRTRDTTIFSRVLYQLSYLAAAA